MHGEKHDSGGRALLPERLCGLEAVEPGHRDVQHHDIGLETQRQVHRLKTVSCSGDDVEVGREQTADRFEVLAGYRQPPGRAVEIALRSAWSSGALARRVRIDTRASRPNEFRSCFESRGARHFIL